MFLLEIKMAISLYIFRVWLYNGASFGRRIGRLLRDRPAPIITAAAAQNTPIVYTAPRLCAAVLKKKEITKNRNVAHLRAERDSQNKRLSPPLESVVVQIAARAVDG